jgi:ATP-dependent helicase Lhr and Lhr-like helicase
MAVKKPTRPVTSDALELFHPVTAAWFRAVFEHPTAPQRLG